MVKKPLTKILVVDDDPDALTIAKYSLELLGGIAIKCVDSGQAALEEAFSFMPDIILLDYQMPGMDGLATLKAIRTIPKTAAIPIVFFTASVQKEHLSVFLQAGAVDIITKPFDVRTLAANIQKIWEKL